MATTFSNVAINEASDDPHIITITATPNNYRQGIILGVDDAISIVSVADNQSNTYNLANTQAGTGNGNTLYFYVSANRLSNGPTSITVDLSASSLIGWCVFAVDGDRPGTNEDINGTGTSTATVTTTFTANNSGQGAIAFLQLNSGETLTAQAGYTNLPGTANFYHVHYDDDIGASGSKTIGGTSGANVSFGICGITFEPAAGGAALGVVPTLIQNYRNMGVM